jgi:hypothetical protein
MKRSLYTIISVIMLSFSLAMLSAAWAAEPREEESLGKEATGINSSADNEKGEKVVVQRLEKEFNVTDAEIQALRDKKVGYGEIAIVFLLAQKTGGITDANISKIMSLREGPPVIGWGEIAKKLDVKLGPTVSEVNKIGKDAEREIKGEAKGEKEGMEKLHGGSHGEMMEHEGMGGSAHGKGR